MRSTKVEGGAFQGTQFFSLLFVGVNGLILDERLPSQVWGLILCHGFLYILVHVNEWGRKRLNPSPVVFLWAYYYSSEKWKGLFCLAFCSSLLLPFITWGLSFFLPCQGQFIWNYLFWWEGRDWHEPFLISLTCKDWWIENQSSFRDTCISSTALHVKILLV